MTYAKTIGIIAVVIGHSGSPLTDFVYQWHIVLFFFISGYFYKETYSKTPVIFIKKRLKSLYLPYVQYGVVFLLLHNLFIHMNIYSTNFNMQEQVSHIYSLTEVKLNLFSTLTLGTKEQLLGIFWFVTALFNANILFCLINYIIEKMFYWDVIKDKEIILFTVVFSLFIAGTLLAFKNIILPRHIDTVFVVIVFYYSGYMYRKHEDRIPISNNYLVIALALLLLNSLYGDIRIDSHRYVNPSFLLVNSFLGIYAIIGISKYLAANLKDGNVLEYIGEHTFIIMALHFISFKMINYLQIIYYDLPIYKLAMFPTIKGYGSYWWILYTLCGLFIPLGMRLIVDRLNKYIIK